MELKTAKSIVKRLNKNSGDGKPVASLYEGYSGRFMFGTKTAAAKEISC